MRVEIVYPCWVGGKPYKMGDVVECKENDAKVLLGMGRAKKVALPAKDNAASAGPEKSEPSKGKKGKEGGDQT